jgi:hypothetical protein
MANLLAKAIIDLPLPGEHTSLPALVRLLDRPRGYRQGLRRRSSAMGSVRIEGQAAISARRLRPQRHRSRTVFAACATPASISSIAITLLRFPDHTPVNGSSTIPGVWCRAMGRR